MADIDFPNYGIILTGQFKEVPATNIYRSEFESGDIKQARISEFQRTMQNITVVYTHAEYQTFKLWYRQETLDGALYFNMIDHAGAGSPQTIIEARMVGGTYEATPNTRMSHWTVTFQIEYFS